MIRAEKFYEELGKSIRSRREALKMTQGDLGERLKLSRTSITNIECGRQRLLVDQFCRLLEILDCRYEDLLAHALHQAPDQTRVSQLAKMPTVARFVQKALQDGTERS